MKKEINQKLIFDKVFTTSSEKFFIANGMQLAKGFKKHADQKILIYSEDNLSSYSRFIDYRPLKYADEIKQFQNKFRSEYSNKLKFMNYSMRMDIWCIKVSAQLQFLEENPQTFSLYLDSDTHIRNRKIVNLLNEFVQPALNFDCGVFRREDNFLHPETGFITYRNSENLVSAHRSMLNSIFSGSYRNLASWTDCSLLEEEIIRGKIKALDFCKFYDLTTSNPVFESKLRKSFIHLKGARKGKFSRVKLLVGRYK